MAVPMPHGQCLHYPNGSRLTMYDDPEAAIAALIDFLRAVDGAASE